MTRHAWIDATAGVAGDMVLGALIDAGADLAAVQQVVDAVIPSSVRLTSTPVTRAGQHARHVTVEVITDDVPARTWRTIRDLLHAADIAAPIRDRALATFARLAEAEGRVHQMPPDDVHFHEVGALDSIADVVGVVAALHFLGIDTVSASAVAVGSGRVHTAHGDMGVPVPAVVELAAGWQIHAGGSGELATPTGMALVVTLAERCEDLPALTLWASGAGAGSRDTPGRPNVTRILIGEDVAPERTSAAVVLEANVDDLDPRLWPGVLARLLSAGADDAWLVPITMKKGRPAHVLTVLARPDRVVPLREIVLAHTSTLGVRETVARKTALPRGWVDVAVGNSQVAVKVAHRDGTIWQVTPEFDEVERVAAERGVPVVAMLTEVAALAAASGVVVGEPVPASLRSTRR